MIDELNKRIDRTFGCMIALAFGAIALYGTLIGVVIWGIIKLESWLT